jgi:hypothetical protein
MEVPRVLIDDAALDDAAASGAAGRFVVLQPKV